MKTILRNLKKDGFARIQNFLTIKEADKYIQFYLKIKVRQLKINLFTRKQN